MYTVIVNLAVPEFLCEDKLSFHLTFSQNFVYILCLLQTDERQLINQALALFYLFFFWPSVYQNALGIEIIQKDYFRVAQVSLKTLEEDWRVKGKINNINNSSNTSSNGTCPKFSELEMTCIILKLKILQDVLIYWVLLPDGYTCIPVCIWCLTPAAATGTFQNLVTRYTRMKEII